MSAEWAMQRWDLLPRIGYWPGWSAFLQARRVSARNLGACQRR